MYRYFYCAFVDKSIYAVLIFNMRSCCRSLKDGATNNNGDSGTVGNTKKIFKTVKKLFVDNKIIQPDESTIAVNNKPEHVNEDIKTTNDEVSQLNKPVLTTKELIPADAKMVQAPLNNYQVPNSIQEQPKCTSPVQESPKKRKSDDKKISHKNISNKSKMCHSCEAKHSPSACPMLNPEIAIEDRISRQDWLTKKLERSEPSKLNSLFSQSNNTKENLDNNVDEDVKPKCIMTYSEASLPKVLDFLENDKGIYK